MREMNRNWVTKLTVYMYRNYLIGLKQKNGSLFYQAIYYIWKKFFIKFDPEIWMPLENKSLFLNLSHRLPIYYYLYPKYDRALTRICKKIKEIDNKLFLIDIGANIGDTVFFITNEINGNFLCIEGDIEYLPFLEKNITTFGPDNIIKISKNYCGIESGQEFFINRTDGTASILKSELKSNENKTPINIKTLDKIIEENKDFENSNIVKIDTDGFEINILTSGKEFIEKTKPLVFFEFTPELYRRNNQDPKEMWKLLRNYGYREALFYDNFGNPIEIIDMNNEDKINNLIDRIDNENIFYYDVLTYHSTMDKYSEILKSELTILVS